MLFHLDKNNITDFSGAQIGTECHFVKNVYLFGEHVCYFVFNKNLVN